MTLSRPCTHALYSGDKRWPDSVGFRAKNFFFPPEGKRYRRRLSPCPTFAADRQEWILFSSRTPLVFAEWLLLFRSVSLRFAAAYIPKRAWRTDDDRVSVSDGEYSTNIYGHLKVLEHENLWLGQRKTHSRVCQTEFRYGRWELRELNLNS